jgi:hypothetical protein
MSSSSLLSAFNDHFVEFISDIQSIFPSDADVLTAKNSLVMIRKANPKMIVKIWNTYVVGKYRSEIESGNLDFFVNKDYSQDITNTDNQGKIMECIDRLRNPIKQMGAENQAKTMKYIQNLTKLAALYESTN